MEWLFMIDDESELLLDFIDWLRIVRMSWAPQICIFYDYRLGELRTPRWMVQIMAERCPVDFLKLGSNMGFIVSLENN